MFRSVDEMSSGPHGEAAHGSDLELARGGAPCKPWAGTGSASLVAASRAATPQSRHAFRSAGPGTRSLGGPRRPGEAAEQSCDVFFAADLEPALHCDLLGRAQPVFVRFIDGHRAQKSATC